VNSFKYTYTYDANGNSVTGKYESWVNSSWEPASSYGLTIFSNKIRIWELWDKAYRYEAVYSSFNSGINTLQADNSLFIYPNPCRDIVNIGFNNIKPVQGNIAIVDLLGFTVKEFPMTGPEQQLDISDLPQGTYFVYLTNGKIRYSRKLIVLK
jgi:hypothetical protein